MKTAECWGATYDLECVEDIDAVEIVDPRPSALDVLIAAEELRIKRPESPHERLVRERRAKVDALRVEKPTAPRKRRARIATTPDELRWEMEIEAIRSACESQTDGECAVCGSGEGRLHRHHEDYFKPHETITLCTSHHRKRHWRLKHQNRDVAAVYIGRRRAGEPAPPEANRRQSEARCRFMARAS